MTDRDWKSYASAFVRQFVQGKPGTRFSANDIWEAGMERHPQDSKVLNGILIRLERQGLIEKTLHKVPSVRGHGTKIRLWQIAVPADMTERNAA